MEEIYKKIENPKAESKPMKLPSWGKKPARGGDGSGPTLEERKRKDD